MSSDISSTRVVAPGLAVPQRTRLKGVFMTSSGGGTVTFRNGALAGAGLCALDMPAIGSVNVIFPGDGIVYPLGIYVDIAGAIASVTMFYG